MERIIYTEKKTYYKFDETRYMVYLNEEVIPDYIPENLTDKEEQPEPVTGYAYSGMMLDGGTLIQAKEASYPDFVSGLIRLKYSADAEAAIQANMITAITDPESPRATEFRTEWDTFQAYREQCKEIAKVLLA